MSKKDRRGRSSPKELHTPGKKEQGYTQVTEPQKSKRQAKGAPPAPPAPPEQKGINWFEAGQLILVVLVIAAICVFTLEPLGKKLEQQLGLDLQGGVHAVYQAVPSTGSPVTADSVTKLIGVIRNRVDKYGVAEPVIQKVGTDRVSVDLPGVKNPEQVVEDLMITAQMEFKTEDGKTVLTGKYLKDAQAQLDSSNQPIVSLTFDSAGAKIFDQVTKNNIGKTISIVLDNKVISSPNVSTEISDGNAQIEGGFQSLTEAQNLAVLLRSGSLPVNVKLLEKRTVGPTLGRDSLDRSIKAGLIGLAFIFLFMLAYYRVPGVVADLSLIVYTLIVIGLYILIRATLTLPGIAGFILSIGMAVDANILIYERIKEELRTGKTLRAAFDAGFRHALRTILDCNVNTLIAAAVLYYFGSGTIRGFAVTLALGVFTSLFTAVTFTRFILHLLARSRLVTNHKAYGV